jgi:2-polyprenyl-6-methoxyphenol hydroxylase-like FAD-dependent oxidoreductase
MYDAIVIGARCAGSTTAMMLARKGHRVLMVDRATFPSDTVSTHNILHRGLVKLHEMGLYQRIVATGCPEFSKRTRDDGDFPLTGYIPRAKNGLAYAMCPRRSVLDKILVDAAVEAGVEVREGFAARELRFDGDRVIGLTGTTRGGHSHSEEARIVIGADGRHSFVASTVKAPKYKEVPPIACWYYTYWPGIQDLGHVSASRHNRHLIMLPTHGGLTCVLIGWPAAEFGRVRTNVEQEYHAALRAVSPEIAERVREQQPAERYYGTADVPNFFRKPFGPGWALVGDAGHHRDPVGAHGISDAVRDADILAAEIHAGLSSERPMLQALASYEERRNEAAFPLFEANCRLAGFVPPSAEEFQIRAALRSASQEDINAYFDARYGTLPRAAFFNEENVARILRSAEHRNPPEPEQDALHSSRLG